MIRSYKYHLHEATLLTAQSKALSHTRCRRGIPITQERSGTLSTTIEEESRVRLTSMRPPAPIIQCSQRRVFRGLRNSCCVLPKSPGIRTRSSTSHCWTVDDASKQFRTQKESGKLWTNHASATYTDQGWSSRDRTAVASFLATTRLLRCRNES